MNRAASRQLKAGILLPAVAVSLWLVFKAFETGAHQSSDFMPHGYCYLWDPRLVWLHVISDSLITLSYYCIPIILIYFIRKNRDLPFNRIFLMFGVFILACGTTHLIEVWNVWHGSYMLAGIIKAITATVSVITAAMLVPLVPRVMSLPQLLHLEEANRRLQQQIAERNRFDAPIEGPLRHRVNSGFVVAMLLTVFLSVFFWLGARRTQQDAYWLAHTHEVIETIQRLSRHVIETETSARAFSLTGQEPLLEHYNDARESIPQDESLLRHLTADNSDQQRRLDILEPRVQAAMEFAENIIAKRAQSKTYQQSNQVLADAVETEKHMDAVRNMAQAMIAEETDLLAERSQRAPSGQRQARIIAIVGAILGIVLWALAWLAVKREIHVSEQARSQLGKLNAQLEQRVEQRTAALRTEIAERERTAEARERLAAVVDSSDDAIIGKDLDGTITAWNRGAQKLFGYTAQEAIGQSIAILIPPDRSNEESEIMDMIRHGQGADHLETIRVRKDGGEIYVSATISPIRDRSGAIVGASKIARDITERKRDEEVLREQARVLDLAQVMVRDLEGRILLWSHGIANLYGYNPEEALGQISHELLRTEFPEPLKRIEETLLQTGTWQGELVHRKRDQDHIIVESMWALHRDADGNPLRVLEVSTDITARKEADRQIEKQADQLYLQSEELLRSQKALETQRVMLQSVLDSMEEGMVAIDKHGKFLLWNPAATRIVGMGAANVPPSEWSKHYGVYMTDMVTPFPAEENPLARAAHGVASSAIMYLRNPELTEGVWLEVTGSPLRDEDGSLNGGMAAFRDITRRRQDEQKIHSLNEELEEKVVQRTAQLEVANHELEAFTYSVSHDLRAPLRHIAGFSKILSEDFGAALPAHAHQYLQRIEHGVHRMGMLIDELLNLARVGRHALKIQPTGLNPVIEEVVAMLQQETEGRTVIWKIDELPPVECDPVLVKQVFQNLIANALKFSRSRERAVIEISHRLENGEHVIAVHDNGVGFDMKYADKLFGVFQRLHRTEDFEGTGIGLATAQRIVSKHGGRIWAEAELDKGATFFFTLAAGQSASAVTAADQSVTIDKTTHEEAAGKTAAAGTQI